MAVMENVIYTFIVHFNRHCLYPSEELTFLSTGEARTELLISQPSFPWPVGNKLTAVLPRSETSSFEPCHGYVTIKS
jgi:hypothetical protein